MAYSAVPTKNTGDSWSASDHNTYLRDNLAAMAPDIFTTKGDLQAATGADASARLAAGANGTVLQADSAESVGMKWASAPAVAARYKVAATKTAASGSTPTIIQFDTSVFDTDSAVTTGASWKFTVPTGKGGYYLVMASAMLQATTNFGINEYMHLQLYKNGSFYSSLGAIFSTVSSATGFRVYANGLTIVSLAAGDYIDVRLLHNSGSNETIDSDGDIGHIAIARLF